MSEEAFHKAKGIRLVIFDVDGVLTDGRIFYAGQAQTVAFHVQDGSGIKYLQRAGIRTALITGRDTDVAAARARTLGIETVVQGAKVKIEAYEQVRADSAVEDSEVAYVGDDLPDIPVMRAVGLSVAVPNAVPEVIEQADLVLQTPGGQGAARELAEFILKAQGKWQEILQRYFD